MILADCPAWEAYTVYFDLVLCDASGRLLCNGRPDRYPCVGQRVGECGWFSQARRTPAGSDRFGSEGPLRRTLSYEEPLIVFSCAVRQGGEPSGEVLGVLGAVFNWKGLAQTVLQRAQAMLEGESEHGVRAYFCDSEGTLLADSEDRLTGKLLPIPDLQQLKAHPHRYVLQRQGRDQLLAAWAPSPGYETYRSGWNSAIVETRKAES